MALETIRRNEFKDLLEVNELIFEEHEFRIVAQLPEIGAVTYFPKADKLQIHSDNDWKKDGYYFVKNHIKKLNTK